MNKNLKLILIIILLANILLATLKITTGLLGHSSALFSDGINSLLDVFVSIMLLLTLKISAKKPDKDHPYGHQKFEGVAYLIITVILIGIGGGIAYFGLADFIQYFTTETTVSAPLSITLIVSIVAITIKVLMFIVVRISAKKYQLPSLKADAYNHLFDIVATGFALMGIIFARNGVYYLEFIAMFMIGIIILVSSFKMLREAISYLVDEAPSKAVVNAIRYEIRNMSGVETVDELKVRKHMDKLYVEVEIGVLNTLSLEQSHHIAEAVHHHIEKEFAAIHCFVHVNPKAINELDLTFN